MWIRMTAAFAAALAIPSGAVPAGAHHSLAMFDTAQKVTISGKVRQFQWTNPHCYIQLMVDDGTGKMVEWSMELGAPMYLYARGWRPTTLKPGTDVVITVNPLRNGRPGGVVLAVLGADGKAIGKGV